MKERLRTQFSVDDTTHPIGAFRLNYTVSRTRSAGETFGALERPQDANYFSYRMSQFVVEPIVAERGETLEQALRPTSEFRQSVDALELDRESV